MTLVKFFFYTFEIVSLVTVSSFITAFNSRDQVFNKSRDDSALASIYSTYISRELLLCSGSRKQSYAGALIIEPGNCVICHFVMVKFDYGGCLDVRFESDYVILNINNHTSKSNETWC